MLAEEIRTFLKAEQRNMSWLSRESGISQSQISRILSGEQRNSTSETINAIKRVLNGKGERMDKDNEKFVRQLLEQIQQLTNTIHELVKENRKLSEERQGLLREIFEKKKKTN